MHAMEAGVCCNFPLMVSFLVTLALQEALNSFCKAAMNLMSTVTQNSLAAQARCFCW